VGYPNPQTCCFQVLLPINLISDNLRAIFPPKRFFHPMYICILTMFYGSRCANKSILSYLILSYLIFLVKQGPYLYDRVFHFPFEVQSPSVHPHREEPVAAVLVEEHAVVAAESELDPQGDLPARERARGVAEVRVQVQEDGAGGGERWGR
jgi:hypothetical protein